MAGITIPPFVNIDAKSQHQDFIRSYAMNATGGQTEYPRFAETLPGYGSEWKKEVKSRYVAEARVWIAGGEMLARKENFVELDPEVKDHWGIPVAKIHLTHSDNDRRIVADFQQRAMELFRKAGGELMPGQERTGPAGFPGGPGLNRPPSGQPGATTLGSGTPGPGTSGPGTSGPGTSASGQPGSTGAGPRPRPLSSMIHECGTARMSDDAREGVLNSYGQTHDIPNLYVFGGNAFPSTGDKHPTLTMMALTARGCDRVMDQANRKAK